MSPMMQPAPRPIGRRRPASPQPAGKIKRSDTGRLAIVAACLGLVLGFVAIAVVGGWTRTPNRPPVVPSTPEEIEDQARRMVDVEDKWFESLDSTLVGKRVAGAIETNPNAQPDKVEWRTKFVRMNLRAIWSPPSPDAEKRLKPTELETSGTVSPAPLAPSPEREVAPEPPPDTRKE